MNDDTRDGEKRGGFVFRHRRWKVQESLRENKHCYIDKDNCLIIRERDYKGIRFEAYEISLDRCKTPSACLDWIHQINSKTWATPELMNLQYGQCAIWALPLSA
jgi:hypothetical protein